MKKNISPIVGSCFLKLPRKYSEKGWIVVLKQNFRIFPAEIHLSLLAKDRLQQELP